MQQSVVVAMELNKINTLFNGDQKWLPQAAQPHLEQIVHLGKNNNYYRKSLLGNVNKPLVGFTD